MRLPIAIVTGVFVTLGLFYFMANLIKIGGDLPRSDDNENFINFVRVKPNSQMEIRRRELPKKPPPPKKAPKLEKIAIANQESVSTPQIQIDTPKMSLGMNLGDGPFLGKMGSPGSGSGNNDVLPLVRISPRYPRAAASSGKEGWVTLQFDISKSGSTENVEVLKSKPKRIFDRAARRALLKWQYKPQLIDGQPVVKTGLKVTIAFKLDN